MSAVQARGLSIPPCASRICAGGDARIHQRLADRLDQFPVRRVEVRRGHQADDVGRLEERLPRCPRRLLPVSRTTVSASIRSSTATFTSCAAFSAFSSRTRTTRAERAGRFAWTRASPGRAGFRAPSPEPETPSAGDATTAPIVPRTKSRRVITVVPAPLHPAIVRRRRDGLGETARDGSIRRIQHDREPPAVAQRPADPSVFDVRGALPARAAALRCLRQVRLSRMRSRPHERAPSDGYRTRIDPDGALAGRSRRVLRGRGLDVGAERRGCPATQGSRRS